MPLGVGSFTSSSCFIQIRGSLSTVISIRRRKYRGSTADQAASDPAHRPQTCKLVENRALARAVARKLKERWSPEQTAGWLKRKNPDDESYQVSHETI
jgi:IS30 family transposase